LHKYRSVGKESIISATCFGRFGRLEAALSHTVQF
jgi:hypothetical protein